jgi:uncharacterized protein YbjT (DUF2867 family)
MSQLLQAGLMVRVMSRRPAPAGLPVGVTWAQADLVTGEGVQTAVSHTHTIIHAASNMGNKGHATDVDGTARLLAAAKQANIEQLLYISIVGIDKIPLGYYQTKLAAEQLITHSPIPWAILRATQFYELVDMILNGFARLPVLLLPKQFVFQPIAAVEVAARLTTAVLEGENGRLPDLAGPELLPIATIAAAWQQSRGLHKPMWQVPLPGKTAAAFRAGYNTVPHQAGAYQPDGSMTWGDWLAARYGQEMGEKTAVVT